MSSAKNELVEQFQIMQMAIDRNYATLTEEQRLSNTPLQAFFTSELRAGKDWNWKIEHYDFCLKLVAFIKELEKQEELANHDVAKTVQLASQLVATIAMLYGIVGALHIQALPLLLTVELAIFLGGVLINILASLAYNYYANSADNKILANIKNIEDKVNKLAPTDMYDKFIPAQAGPSLRDLGPENDTKELITSRCEHVGRFVKDTIFNTYAPIKPSQEILPNRTYP